ncbi:ATP-binding protein, partial [Streptomyces albidoflavus]
DSALPGLAAGPSAPARSAFAG